MATKEFKLPDVGEGVAEGELVSWLVAPGDTVTEDQAVAEVETDKALVEVPSPYNGTVKELRAEEGEMVPVGDVIITFEVPEEGEVEGEGEAEAAAGAEGEPEDEAEPEAETAAEPETAEATAEAEEVSTGKGRTFAPPSARRVARELGVDVSAVDGSGPGGRVTEADVREHAESGGAEPEPTPEPSERKSAVTKREPEAGAEVGAGAETGAGAGRSVEPAEAAEAANREKTLAVPATRRVAREEGVDINEVPTDETREGEAFVTEEQVREFAAAKRGEVEAVEGAEAAEAQAGAPEAGAEVAGPKPSETRPYTGVRRTIGKQMAQSKYTAPHVTHHDTAEVTDLVDARARLKPKAEAREVKLTYMPFVMKAIVAGLKEYPILNSELHEEAEEIEVKNYYNIGIAVATDAGLMVPVVENVDEKGLVELAAEVNDLATRARERKLKPAEMKGGTFTITNFGAIGGEYATPIINYPETAILGLGGIEKRPVVEGDDVVARETLPLSLSIDHRVIDGAEAAEFTNTVMEHLNNPLLLLTE
ncbi:dihydrolipoamide acetyltransferase family protein [Haloparvum sp. PAK95]|uniref:dihydrolipoamide acetyltransferase family protein n=1 Tax=Haloparvum sp. PAK95 TaxID=3418962 RepID=UPI003D2F06B6